MTSARSSKDLFPGGSESITALPKITAYPPLQVTGLERGHRAGHPPLAAAWDRSAACVQPGEFPLLLKAQSRATRACLDDARNVSYAAPWQR